MAKRRHKPEAQIVREASWTIMPRWMWQWRGCRRMHPWLKLARAQVFRRDFDERAAFPVREVRG